MTCLRLSQVRLSNAGSCAMAFQKLLIQSILRVAMRVSQTTGVHIVKDGNRKRTRLGSSECSCYWRQNYEAWLARARPRAREKRHCVVSRNGQKGANFRAGVHGMRRGSIPTMNFLGPPNEIHSS